MNWVLSWYQKISILTSILKMLGERWCLRMGNSLISFNYPIILMFLVEDSCLPFDFYDKLFLFILSQVIAPTFQVFSPFRYYLYFKVLKWNKRNLKEITFIVFLCYASYDAIHSSIVSNVIWSYVLNIFKWSQIIIPVCR